MRRLLFLGLASFVLGCGGGSPAAITGTVDGVSLTPKTAIYAFDSTQPNLMYVGIFELSDPCGDLKAGRNRPGDVALGFELDATDGNFVAGDYPAWGGTNLKLAFANFIQTDAACHDSNSEFAEGGTVTLNTAPSSGPSAAVVSGVFSLKMGSKQEPISGSFDAAFCDQDLHTAPNQTCTP